MNDRNQRHRTGEPAWPTGDDPDAARWPAHEEPQERTGFWSPLWEDDEDAPPPRRPAGNGHANGHSNGHGKGTGHSRRGPAPVAQQPTTPSRPPARPGAGPTVALPTARTAAVAPPRPPVSRDRSEDPTDLLPPVPDGTRREPDLLTHREPDYDDGLDEPAADDQHRPLSEADRRKRRKKIWRRIRRTMYVFIVLMIIGPILAFFIAYQLVDVPSPLDIAAGQNRNVVLQYADGKELAKIVPKSGDRVMVEYKDIPQQVLNAVFAAEDATFMSNAGFDLSGVMRAGWNQVTGGDGGGSTITQQYIKQATGEDERTLTRKGLEVVKAYKMNRTYDKRDIITAYLNTVYFGRNAYGIAAAAKSYYAKDLKDLTPSESALLAGMIQSPGRFKDEAYMQRRWNYVMDQLVANNWFPGAQRKAEKFPAPVPYAQTKAQALTDARGHIQEAALKEVERVMDVSREEIFRNGWTIQTTIDPTAQELAQQAVDEVMKGQPDNLRPALVAVDPNTGEIKAYWGGSDGVGTDWANEDQEPGSAFKPFDLVALLQKGKGLGDTFDGSSPRKFKGIGQPIRNSGGTQCNPCTVADAMKRSINTVFYQIALEEVGTRKVLEAAQQAGITTPWSGDDANPGAGISIGGDKTQVSTVDMAGAYATFAARGVKRSPHLVAKVLNPDGSLYWQAQVEDKKAFDNDATKNEKIARNVTEALLPVPKYSKIACADNRLCAGKTGTHQLGETGKNAKAWMVGYTPQISAAVSLSGINGTAIGDIRGDNIFGAEVPGQIWQKFMDRYHKAFNLKKEEFGKYDPIGKGSSSSEDQSSTSRKPPSNTQQPTTTTTRNRPTDPPNPTTTTTRTRTTKPTITVPTVGDPGEEAP